MDDRPSLDAHHVQPIALPHEWPEATAYRAGARLFGEGADEVPMMQRDGLPITQYLTPEEVEALVELRDSAWGRWFRLGWARAAAIDEQG
jgi:hypothetical protein